MKKLISYFIISTGLLIGADNSFAQFNDASTPQYTYGIAPVISQNTGNDILEYNSINYEVSVSDDPNGNNALLGFKVGSTIGFITIGQGGQILDPDVCLVKNGNNTIFAVVAFYEVTTNEFMWQVLVWNVAQQTFLPQATDVLAGGVFNKTINIDSDGTNYFAITWDEPGNLVNMVFGSAIGSAYPSLGLGGNVLAMDPGSEPDLCVYRNPSNNYRQIDLVYKHTSGIIAVDFYKVSDLLAGVIAATPIFRSPAADLMYRYPRIACPVVLSGASEDFTVVVEDSDANSTWYIKSFNYSLCCTPNIVYSLYNDGGTGYSPWNLTMVPNTRPVVAYDDASTTIWIAWNLDNSFGLLNAPGASIGKYPVALATDKRSEIINGSKFMVVPFGVTFGSDITNISVAGNKSTQALFSFNENMSSEMNSKTVPHLFNGQFLKHSESNSNLFSWLNQVHAENKSEHPLLSLNLLDLTGRQVLSLAGDPENIRNSLTAYSDNCRPTVFMVRVYAENGKVNYSGKLFLGK